MPNKEEWPKLGWIDWYNLTYFSDHVELMFDDALGDYTKPMWIIL